MFFNIVLENLCALFFKKNYNNFVKFLKGLANI
jgi:hypothetical protein